jgi:hypothetical protein
MLTQARLKELLHYDPETGKWHWLVFRRGCAVPGAEAGSIHGKTRYLRISIDNRSYLAHRLAWLYMTGEWPAEEVDHKDTDRSNNRWLNLREATSGQNNSNRAKLKNNTSGRKGVSWVKRDQKWRVMLMADGKHHNLGTFTDLDLAGRVYEMAAYHYHGEYARAA